MRNTVKRLGCAACVAVATVILPAVWTGCASTSTRESTGEYIDDSTITAKIKAAFAKDPVVSAMEVNVETYKGVVQLSGFVKTADQIQQAQQLAGSVAGVRSIHNNIVVRPAG